MDPKGGRGIGSCDHGSDGSVGLGQSARLKGAWVGCPRICPGVKSDGVKGGGTLGEGGIHTLDEFSKPTGHQSNSPI